jgi:hypothetical protein
MDEIEKLTVFKQECLWGIYCLEKYHVDRKIVLKEIKQENVRDFNLFCSGSGAVM